MNNLVEQRVKYDIHLMFIPYLAQEKYLEISIFTLQPL